MAAHISAASPGGARFDGALTSELRADIANGIWLCQTHAKLIDDDEFTFSSALLREWKETAERMAFLEARGYAVPRAAPFPDLEKKAPKLIAEMREDLKNHPLVREFIFMPRGAVYSGDGNVIFEYIYEEHEYLPSVMTIMEHANAIYEVTFNSVKRYKFTEEFVSFLVGTS